MKEPEMTAEEVVMIIDFLKSAGMKMSLVQIRGNVILCWATIRGIWLMYIHTHLTKTVKIYMALLTNLVI